VSTVIDEPDAVEKVVCPTTLSVPPAVKEDVATRVPAVVVPVVKVVIFASFTVRLSINAIAALNKETKKLVAVAFTKVVS
jgi:hypothetical protein